MDETEWLTCNDPQRMLMFLPGTRHHRKLRIFIVLCCRRFWPLLVSRSSQRAVETAERFLEGLASNEDLRRAAINATTRPLSRAMRTDLPLDERAHLARAAKAASWAAKGSLAWGGLVTSGFAVRHAQQPDQERALHGVWLRDLYGPLIYRNRSRAEVDKHTGSRSLKRGLRRLDGPNSGTYF
jgi:hypothetical protein